MDNYRALPTRDPDELPNRDSSSDIDIFKRVLQRQNGRGEHLVSDMHHIARHSVISNSMGPPPVATSEMTWLEYGEEVLEAMPFQIFMAFAIVANALVIGFETDMPDLHLWDFIEAAFLVVFTGELVFRLVVIGLWNFFDFESNDFWWNCFDFSIVGLGIFDTATTKIAEAMADEGVQHSQKGGGISTLFRIIRLLRILRIFRIVRFLKQLYLLVYGFGAAAVATGWVTFLAVVIIYVCSIVLVRMVQASDPEEEHYKIYLNRFGSVGMSMFTLFQLMLNPDLSPYEDSLQQYFLIGAFLFGFVIFGSFGMLALLTGVISESMFEKNQVRLEEERGEREKKRKILEKVCSDLFDELSEGYEELQIDKLKEHANKLTEFFFKFGFAFTEYELVSVFHVTDIDDSGGISKKEFVHAVCSSSEGVQCANIMELHQNVMLQGIKAEKRHAELAAQLEALSEALGLQPVVRGSQRSRSPRREHDAQCRNTSPIQYPAWDASKSPSTRHSKRGMGSTKENPIRTKDESPSFYVGIDSMLALKIDACEAMVREMRRTTSEIAKSTRELLKRTPTSDVNGQRHTEYSVGPDPWDGLEFVAPLDIPEMQAKFHPGMDKRQAAQRRSRSLI